MTNKHDFVINLVAAIMQNSRTTIRLINKLVSLNEKPSKVNGKRLSIVTTKITAGLTILIAIIFISSCGKEKSPTTPKQIDSAKVVRGSIERNVLFTGNIEAQDAIDIFPKASGKVSKKLLNEGDDVKRNQAILLVDRDEIGYKFKAMPITSPIDGLIGVINVDVGTHVDTNTPVATVVQPGNMRLKLDMPERYLNSIKLGTNIEMAVDYLDQETFSGTIITASPVVDEKTRTAKIEADIPNPNERLRHGMFGRLNLAVENKDDTLIVPIGSISWEGEKQFVYKIIGGKLKRKEVKTGLRNDKHVEILEGLAESDEIAVGNLLNLKDGEAVAIK